MLNENLTKLSIFMFSNVKCLIVLFNKNNTSNFREKMLHVQHFRKYIQPILESIHLRRYNCNVFVHSTCKSSHDFDL